ncbi:MAG: DUF2807 domain-containing protein, partial [Acidobacteriota bacterium]|nr:DUF2807 domain-containing protein [Acidobacteriota bacterium]
MRRAALFLTLALALAGCKFGSFSTKTGSGNMKVEKRTVPAFTSVNVSGAFDVEIVVRDEQSLEIEGDDNLLPLIKTEVKNGVLEIGNTQSINTKRNLRVRVSVQKLDGVSTSGASDIVVTGVKSDQFDIESSGASHLKVTGEAKAVTVDTSGAGEIDAKDLHAEKVNITSTGAAHADVYASEELRASVSG